MPEPAARTAEGTGTDLVEYPILSDDGIGLSLVRHVRGGSKAALHTVLLLHGASASSHAFRIPRSQSLVDFLLEQGSDVWTLDWRGSNRVSSKHSKDYEKFTLDAAAKLDLPLALEHIRALKPGVGPLAVFGHCMGAGTLAMAIGAGFIKAAEVGHVVLSTLGLFYQVPWDGWVKAEDHTLERIPGGKRGVTCIDADTERNPWPDVMEQAYDRWPATFLPPEGNEIFRRLSFMFGQPYRPDLLPDDICTEAELRRQFGEIPLRLYMHCAQNVRRGFAAPFDHTDWDRKPDATYLNVENFQDIDLTLITGSRNELWHPDAIHRMYDWLRRRLGEADCRKRIFPGYAHQDLLWGETAPDDVYPTIAKGLGLS